MPFAQDAGKWLAVNAPVEVVRVLDVRPGPRVGQAVVIVVQIRATRVLLHTRGAKHGGPLRARAVISVVCAAEVGRFRGVGPHGCVEAVADIDDHGQGPRLAVVLAQNQDAARAQDSKNFSHTGRSVGDVVQDHESRHDIERGVWVGQRAAVRQGKREPVARHVTHIAAVDVGWRQS